jgi:hypothetical protein
MFLLVFAVPALGVVVVGYVVGYGLWAWVGGLLDSALGTSLAPGAEVAGWVTSVVLLVALTRVALIRLRRRSRRRRTDD